MAKRPERMKDYDNGWNPCWDLWKAYEKESEITKDELIEEMKSHENYRHSIIDKNVLADSILAAMKQKKGEK